MELCGVSLDQLYPVQMASHKVPGRRPGKRVSARTLERWRTKGLRGGLRLRAVLVGGQFCTCDRWLEEFFAQLNSPGEESASTPGSSLRTVGQRRRAADEARAELDRRREQRMRLSPETNP
jgi:hypothetical protein